MTSPEQLTNGNEEDPYISKGHIELKIENFSGFAQEELYSQRLSADPVYVRGVPWKILAKLRECNIGQKLKCLGYYLQCDAGTDPFWSYSANIKLKLLAHSEESAGHVREFSHIFNAERNSWSISPYMTIKVEDIMNPDRGFYDEQGDFIVLAVDFTVDLPVELGKYVLVAVYQLKLDNDPTRFSMQIGHMEWEINTKDKDNSVVLTGKDVGTKGKVDKVLIELIGYHREDPKSVAYSPLPVKPMHRHLFTAKDNSLTVKVPGRSANLLFTIRVYKERSQFPDFTKETAIVEQNTANVKLRVGDQQFHVNKQFISMHSLFFDRMFHGDYPAATQQEVELSLLTHSAELFHDFLLVLCFNEALPNSVNVAALFKLADFYDAENVRQKCDQHLRMAREMPIEKRMQLALDHGNEETRTLILDSANLEQSKRIIVLLMEHYPTKH